MLGRQLPLLTYLRLGRSRSLVLTGSIRNRHNERPADLLPPSHPSADPESDDEMIRAAIRRAEAEAAVADKGDIADGEFDYWLPTL
jgi:hypothetical protein